MINSKLCALVVVLSAFSLFVLSGSVFARPGGAGGFHGPFGSRTGADILEKLDENADGVVTLGEFTTTRTDRAERRFDALDQNDNGAISEEEYNAAFSGRFAGRHGDFELDQEAFKQCMEDQLGEAFDRRPTWEELVTEVGVNNEDEIEKADFLAHQEAEAAERFNEIDTSADGSLDEAELDAVSVQMQERRTARMTCKMEQREMNGVLAF